MLGALAEKYTTNLKTRFGRHFSSFFPQSQNYGGQAERISATPDPGLKPWAVLYRRFATKARQFGTKALS